MKESAPQQFFKNSINHIRNDFRLRVFLTLLFVVSFFAFSWQLQRSQTATTSLLSMRASNTNLRVGDMFTLGVGLQTQQPIVSIDSVIFFNSNLLDVMAIQNGVSNFKTMLPETNGTFDLSHAILINPTDPTRSRIEVGLISFDKATNQTTQPVNTNYDPTTNPLFTIIFRAKAAGAAGVQFRYSGTPDTIDSNIVTVAFGAPQDIMATPNTMETISITAPTPTPSPIASTSPVATPRPTATPVATPRPSATPLATPRPTATPVATPRPSATPSPTLVPTPVPTPRPTATPVATPQPTATPVATTQPTATPRPSATATPRPTLIASARPSATPAPSGLSCQPYDVSGDARVNLTDAILVFFRIGNSVGDANYAPRYDVNGNGTITWADVNAVLQRLGMDCR